MTLSVTRNPDVLSGAPCIAGTRLPVAWVQQWRDFGWSWDSCRDRQPTLACVSDAVLDDAVTYPRLPRREWVVDTVTVTADGDNVLGISGFVALANLPALIAALREAEQVVREWLDAVTAWEQARTEQAP